MGGYAGTVAIEGTMTFASVESKTQGQELRTYCDYVVEENEEAFTDAIRGGAEDLDARVCIGILQVCASKEEMELGPRSARDEALGKDLDKPKAVEKTSWELEQEAEEYRKRMKKLRMKRNKKRRLAAAEQGVLLPKMEL